MYGSAGTAGVSKMAGPRGIDNNSEDVSSKLPDDQVELASRPGRQ